MDRHEKWVKVEPGTTIPAGQPYRLEWNGPHALPDEIQASERVCHDHDMPVKDFGKGVQMLVDSSWRPPLELPTDPEGTWGIVKHAFGTHLGVWRPIQGGDVLRSLERDCGVDTISDFIPLTPEQVERIEQQR